MWQTVVALAWRQPMRRVKLAQTECNCSVLMHAPARSRTHQIVTCMSDWRAVSGADDGNGSSTWLE